MRVGIDFDGVLCDTMTAMIAYGAGHGLRLTPRDCIGAGGPAGLTAAQFVRLVEDTHRTAYALEMAPIDGAIEAMHDIGRDHDLFIVTARRDAAYENAQRWVAQFGLTPLIREFVSTAGTTKAAICQTHSLDVLIDDFPQHLDGLPTAVLPILWHAEYNAEAAIVPPMERVTHWAALTARLRSR